MKILICADMFPAMIETVTRQFFDALGRAVADNVKRLKRGELLVMFPEGRRSETGQLMEAKRGAGMVAILSKAPIIPTYVHNTDKVLPVGATWLKRGKVTVVFDKPIYYKSTISSDSYSSAMSHEDISRKIMDAIGKLKRDYEDKAG